MVSQAQPTNNKKSLIRQLFMTISIVLLMVVYFAFYKLTGVAIPCLFYEITGWYCPGCGISRMLLALGRGEFYQAFRYNPLLFIALPVVVILLINWLYAKYYGKKSWYEKVPEWAWIALLVVVVVYGILRNLSMFSYLAPTIVD